MTSVRLPRWLWKSRKDTAPLTTSELRKALAWQLGLWSLGEWIVVRDAVQSSGGDRYLGIAAAVLCGIIVLAKALLLVAPFVRECPEE